MIWNFKSIWTPCLECAVCMCVQQLLCSHWCLLLHAVSWCGSSDIPLHNKSPVCSSQSVSCAAGVRGGEQNGMLPPIKVPFGHIFPSEWCPHKPHTHTGSVFTVVGGFCPANLWLKWHHFVPSASAFRQTAARVENTSAVCLHTATPRDLGV